MNLKEIKFYKGDIIGGIVLAVLLTLGFLVIKYGRQVKDEDVAEQTNVVMGERSGVCELREFDPNTVELRELLSFGLSRFEALSILRYRASGKVFNIKEEVIGCYGISDSLYFALEPYIVIGEEFQYKKRSYETLYSAPKATAKPKPLSPSPFLVDTVSEKYLVAIGALTPRQAEVFVRWRDMSGIHTFEELAACYVVSQERAEWLKPHVIFTPREVKVAAKSQVKTLVDLNKADTTELKSVYGIGSKTANAIVEYRERLGGFYSKEQLSEIKIITESNFEKIITQISVDSCDISKININFATAKQLSRHPYFTNLKIRKLLKIKQLKGGWSTLEEITEDNIFTEEEAQRVRPYLHFEVQGLE